jgi:hypothetical protein
LSEVVSNAAGISAIAVCDVVARLVVIAIDK